MPDSSFSHDNSQSRLVLIIHCGAGAHNKTSYEKYEKIMKKACLSAIKVFKKTKSVRLSVVECIRIMENSSLVNAGHGSSLSINGEIECDAGLLNINNGKWSAMSGLTHIKNPICAVNKLYQKSFGQFTHGRLKPIFLSGKSAEFWCKNNEIEVFNNNNLDEGVYPLHVTKHTQKLWHEYKDLISGKKPKRYLQKKNTKQNQPNKTNQNAVSNPNQQNHNNHHNNNHDKSNNAINNINSTTTTTKNTNNDTNDTNNTVNTNNTKNTNDTNNDTSHGRQKTDSTEIEMKPTNISNCNTNNEKEGDNSTRSRSKISLNSNNSRGNSKSCKRKRSPSIDTASTFTNTSIDCDTLSDVSSITQLSQQLDEQRQFIPNINNNIRNSRSNDSNKSNDTLMTDVNVNQFTNNTDICFGETNDFDNERPKKKRRIMKNKTITGSDDDNDNIPNNIYNIYDDNNKPNPNDCFPVGLESTELIESITESSGNSDDTGYTGDTADTQDFVRIDNHGTCGVIGYCYKPSKRNKQSKHGKNSDNDVKMDGKNNNTNNTNINKYNSMYVGTSSGGIWLKCNGRIGPSSMVGMGFDGKYLNDNFKIGSCCSGTGEYIMDYRLSNKLCDRIVNNSIHNDNINDNDKYIPDNEIIEQCIQDYELSCANIHCSNYDLSYNSDLEDIDISIDNNNNNSTSTPTAIPGNNEITWRNIDKWGFEITAGAIIMKITNMIEVFWAHNTQTMGIATVDINGKIWTHISENKPYIDEIEKYNNNHHNNNNNNKDSKSQNNKTNEPEPCHVMVGSAILGKA